MIKNIGGDIANYMQTKELILSLLLTGLFLFLSIVGYTQLSTTEITIVGPGFRESHIIHIVYYGFPLEMIGVLNPIGEMEYYWVYVSGSGLTRILWNGLFLNFVLYFLLAFTIVYLFRRLRG